MIDYQSLFQTLGEDTEIDKYYVYGLFEPDKPFPFYIGKGQGRRITEHKAEINHIIDTLNESINASAFEFKNDEILTDAQKETYKNIIENTLSEKQKIIYRLGSDLEMVIFKWGLTEKQAFMCESALINAYNFSNREKLTNIVNGQMSKREKENISRESKARTLKAFFEECVVSRSIHINAFNSGIRFINIAQTYPQCKKIDKNHFDNAIYDSIRGCRVISKNKQNLIKYVIGIYKSRIVGIYKVGEWKSRMDAIDKAYNISNDFPKYPNDTRSLELMAMKIARAYLNKDFDKIQNSIFKELKAYAKKYANGDKARLEKFNKENPEKIIIGNKYLFNNSKEDIKNWYAKFNTKFYFNKEKLSSCDFKKIINTEIFNEIETISELIGCTVVTDDNNTKLECQQVHDT